MNNIIKFFTVIFSVLVLFSCEKKKSYSKIENKQVLVESTIHKIVINEVIVGGGYTYIFVDELGDKYWIAIPNTEVKVGETYYYEDGMVMNNFESKELDKTFDSIIFADGIRDTEVPTEVKKQENPHKKQEVTYEIIELPKNGTSLVTLFTDKESFLGKEIIVRGKVVKVNDGILDRNWVHIADGTGIENKKQLTITTKEFVKVDDTVTFKGVITLNKDFGYGYVYDILLEEGGLLK